MSDARPTSDDGAERDTELPKPESHEAADPDERVPGEQGGTVPEQHGGVDRGSDAIER